jgi:hypothetical protein
MEQKRNGKRIHEWYNKIELIFEARRLSMNQLPRVMAEKGSVRAK